MCDFFNMHFRIYSPEKTQHEEGRVVFTDLGIKNNLFQISIAINGMKWCSIVLLKFN